MSLIFENCLQTGFVITIFLLVAFVSYIKWRQKSLQRRNITTSPPTFFVGDIGGMLRGKESFAALVLRLYRYFREKNVPFGGYYTFFVPQIMPIDPELVKHILIRDFDHFVDRGIYINEKGDPLSAHLFSLEGSKWKTLRAKLTPTFTSGKMKMMFETIVNCGQDLKDEMDKTASQQSVDIRNILSRFTADVICSSAFGIDCNCLKNPHNDILDKTKYFLEGPIWWNALQFFCYMFPNQARKLNLPAIYPAASRYFGKTVRSTVKFREKNNIFRKDFMHLLIQLKNRGELIDDEGILKTDNNKKDVTLTLDEISAQAFIFFLGGYETSSTTMTFCLYELASNQEIQEDLRQEVKGALQKFNGNLSYEAIMEMQYMDKVINETLRKYPPLGGLLRVCTKNYKIPGSDITIKEGTKMFIPIMGLHYDEAYYPNPEKFDPERFSEENKRSRPACTFIPFGEGPRICVGMRFGLMQTKVGLAVLLNNYKFTVSPKTKQPLKFDQKTIVTKAEGVLWLDYVKI